MSDDEQSVEKTRRRAYLLWEQAGRPHGRHEEFWHAAGNEDLTDDTPGADDEPVSASPGTSTPGTDGLKPTSVNSKGA